MKIPKHVRRHYRVLPRTYWEGLNPEPVAVARYGDNAAISALYRRGALAGKGNLYGIGVVDYLNAVLLPTSHKRDGFTDRSAVAVLIDGTPVGYLPPTEAVKARVLMGYGGWRSRKRYATVAARVWARRDLVDGTLTALVLVNLDSLAIVTE